MQPTMALELIVANGVGYTSMAVAPIAIDKEWVPEEIQDMISKLATVVVINSLPKPDLIINTLLQVIDDGGFETLRHRVLDAEIPETEECSQWRRK